MGRWRRDAAGRRAVAALALAGVLAAAPADAQEAGAARSWSAAQLDPERTVLGWDVDTATSGIAETVVVYSVSRSPERPAIRSVVKGWGEPFPAPQELDVDSFYPTVDGSLAGGAVAAWYHEPTQQVRVAELAPGERTFGAPRSLASTQTNYSYGHPRIAVGEGGGAAVLYLARDASGAHSVHALVREPGGSFGAPETVAGPRPQDDVYARDVAVAPDGTVVAGVVVDGRARVAVRPPGGPWEPPVALGEPAPAHSWQSPRVGVDAAGNVAAAWLEGAPTNATGPVKVAFRPAGGSFGAALDTGLRATSSGRIRFAVSAVGELLLAVEASSDNPYGGTRIEGVHALYGNLARRVIGAPAALTGTWGSYPSLGANARGDAVVVWDECCPLALRARRRGPLGSFGPVVEVQPPIAFEGWRGGRWALDADVDDYGNARATWIDSEPEPAAVFAGEDGPAILDEPPPVPAPGDELPPVLPREDDGDTGAPPGAIVVPPPAPPWTGTPMIDRSAPRVRVTIARRTRGRRTRHVRVRVSCNEPCSVRLAGRLGRARLRPVDVSLPAGGSARIGLATAQRRGGAVSAASRRRALALVRAVAVDPAGNVRRAAARARVR